MGDVDPTYNATARGFQSNVTNEILYLGYDPVVERVIVSGFQHYQYFPDISVSRIVGYAGSGMDELYISEGLLTAVEYHGGAGVDRLFSGGGRAELYGDEGNDFIQAGRGGGTFDGGATTTTTFAEVTGSTSSSAGRTAT